MQIGEQLAASPTGSNKGDFAWENYTNLLIYIYTLDRKNPQQLCSDGFLLFYKPWKMFYQHLPLPYTQIFDYSLWNVSVTSTGIRCRMQTLIDSFLAIKCAYTATTHSKCTQISHFTFKNMNAPWLLGFFCSNIMNELKHYNLKLLSKSRHLQSFYLHSINSWWRVKQIHHSHCIVAWFMSELEKIKIMGTKLCWQDVRAAPCSSKPKVVLFPFFFFIFRASKQLNYVKEGRENASLKMSNTLASHEHTLPLLMSSMVKIL